MVRSRLRVFVERLLIPERRTRGYRMQVVLIDNMVNVFHLVLKIQPLNLIISSILVETILVCFNFFAVNLRIITNHNRDNVNQFFQFLQMQNVLYIQTGLRIDEVKTKMYSRIHLVLVFVLS